MPPFMTDLTDEAIETLYEIVQRAQNAHDGSTRALFELLPPRADASLHRFLFHMQKHRRQGEDLISRFTRVLKESFDIDVEINDGEVTTSLDATNLDATNARATNPGATRNAARHSRTGSFDSFLDVTANKVAGTAHHTRRASATSLQITRGGQMATHKTGDRDADESDFTDRTTSLDLSQLQIPGINAPIPTGPFQSPHQQHQPYIPEPFRPSDTRLMDDAETFEEQRLHRVTRECIRIWRNRTQERMSMREDMERAAAAFDRRVLLRASLEQLRGTALVRRSNSETNRFFDRLETRADKARDIFLLTKAFTHWAKSAEDEVKRTSVARRHILRTRFFNGWRDITAVNELKIQHFALSKFLSKWRARAAAVRDNNGLAVTTYEGNLAKRLFKAWLFRYFNHGAPIWHAKRVGRITLQKWSEIVGVIRERDAWAADRRDWSVLRRTLQIWQQKRAAVQSLPPQAEDLRHTSVLRSSFHTLQKQAQLQPLLRQFQTRVNDRVVRNIFQTWRKDSQLSRQARNVDRMRILRNAYTAWNDRLRIKALEERIDDRVIVECLYKWTLASRVSLFQRVHDRQLKESTFLAWVTKTNQRANTIDAAERRFAQFKRAQLLRTCLRRMETITAERRAEQFAMVAQYDQKLKQRIFDKLKEKQAHFQQLKQWSAAAHFYLVSKHTLKTWSEATQHARRNRRRDAYSQVRRTVKTNVVRRVFQQWRENAHRIMSLNQRANDILENRTLQNSGVLLHQWHDRTVVLRQQSAQASNLHDFKLSTRHLSLWSSRMDTLRTLDSQAIALRQESTEIAAASALKKIGWRLWNIQRQEDNARALYDRTFEKHVRAMIKFWAEQTNERLALRPVSPTPTSRSRGRRDDDYDHDEDDADGGLGDPGDETQRLENWTAFDASALGLNNNDLDLSLSLTPERQPTFAESLQPPSSARPPGSILRRSHTYAQPQSAFRPPPPATIVEDDESNFGDVAQSTFWSGTPMPPTSKPGYLKTPSKRSVARAKRPRGPSGSILARERNLGSMSAPPVQGGRSAGFGAKGGHVTSFERRLREGGFGRGKGSARVGFGDVSEMG